MEDLIPKIQELAMTYGLNLLWAVLTFLVGKWVARLLSKVVGKVATRSGLDATLTKFLCSITYIVLMVVVIMAALDKLGVKTTSFVAIIGAAGLAVGFALQGSLANFAAGVMVIMFRPFKVGDFIEGGGISGVVEEVGIFTTVLKSPDNKKVIIPNGSLTEGSITNYSANETRRVDLVVGVGYDDDLKKVREVLQEIVNADDRILKDPEVTIAVSELADSSVNFVVRPWVRTADYWPVHFSLTEQVKLRFDAEGISIPFPQRDVHVIEEKASA